MAFWMDWEQLFGFNTIIHRVLWHNCSSWVWARHCGVVGLSSGGDETQHALHLRWSCSDGAEGEEDREKVEIAE